MMFPEFMIFFRLIQYQINVSLRNNLLILKHAFYFFRILIVADVHSPYAAAARDSSFNLKEKKMKNKILLCLLLAFLTLAEARPAPVDTAGLGVLKYEALNNQRAMGTLSYLCNVFGPRLMWSKGYNEAAAWIETQLKEWGIPEVYFENINKRGKSWTLKKSYAEMVEPYTVNLIVNPKCWSPGTEGLIRSEAVYFKASKPEEFEKYKGKLKGKIVLLSDAIPFRLALRPMVVRFNDDTLNVLSNVTVPSGEDKLKAKEEEEKNNKLYTEYFSFFSRKVAFCKEEGAALILDAGSRQYGTNIAWGNIAAVLPNDIFEFLINYAGDPSIPESVPQMVVSVEQYNTLIDLLEKNKRVVIEADLQVEKNGVTDGFSVIAEIPGTDLKDEIVMLGGHLDSYTSANGVTDNGTGVVACMEALRNIRTLGLRPRRTIRIALWGAEEEGLIGSKHHIEKHFKNDKEKLCAYFNMDFGVGRFRGIYAEENTGAAAVFKDWMAALNDPKFKTVCLSSVKNSDQEAFYDAGLPGFAFIQDPLDYFRIYHTNMDYIDRVPADDLNQNVYIMSAFAWLAANMNGSLQIN